MKVAVVGLGKIGLPLAVQYASAGVEVVGIDIDPRVVASVNSAIAPFPGEDDLGPRLRQVVGEKALVATTSYSDGLRRADYVVVVVPLLVDIRGIPDFGALDKATDLIGKHVQSGTTVIYETTLPIGTTRNRFSVRLEALTGLVEGHGLFVAFSPERVFSGRIFSDLKKYPKLVGGVSDAATDKASHFYEQVLRFDERPDLPRPNGVWRMQSAEAAEFAKLAETTYRDVNIALANEFCCYADKIGVDIYEVVAASNSQPFSHIHLPGIAVGGHCIPVYPHLYMQTDSDAQLPLLGRRKNEAMPLYSVRKVEQVLGSLSGLKTVILGLAYRGGVKETAFSGAFDLARELESRNAVVTVHDPLYHADEISAHGLVPHQLGSSCDVLFVQADHAGYRDLSASDYPGVTVVFDGRNCVETVPDDVRLLTLGRPATDHFT